MEIFDAIRGILQASPALADQIAWEGWAAEQREIAAQTEQARKYADGEHALKLTTEMSKMLRLDPNREDAPFALNHCENIIATPVDRLNVSAIEADTDAGSLWVKNLLKRNRFDGLQIGVHESAIQDGNTYVLVEFDNAAKEVRFTHEQAFDGVEGMICIYGTDKLKPSAAVKIWTESLREDGKLTTSSRVNFYFADRVEKYRIKDGVATKHNTPGEAWPAPWTKNGQPIGVPVIPFRNHGKRHNAYGVSILKDVIPLQDSLNRLLMSLTMGAELEAFKIRWAVGMQPPSAVTPGMFIYLGPDPAKVPDKQSPSPEQIAWFNSIRFGNFEQGDLSQYLSSALFLIDQMYTITRMPMTKRESSNVSGVALMQLEAGLLGRLRRCHVSFGNSWEDMIMMAYAVQSAYGSVSAKIESATCRWTPAEVRNETEVIDNALKLADYIDERTLLEEIATVKGWDAEKIDLILSSKRGDSAARLAALGGGLGTMNGLPEDDDELDLQDLNIDNLALTEA